MGSSTDFDFLSRNWRVHHRKLATRLAGANDWYEFDGTSSTRSITAGFGKRRIQYAGGSPRPVSGSRTARFRRDAQLWRISWLDTRFPTEIGVPVAGAFDGDRGEFFADEPWQGTPIKLRFIWDKDAGNGPRWEQAFSTDDGRYSQTHRTMDFTRR